MLNATWVLLGLIIAAQLADVWTTMRVLKAGGIEANPLMRFLMRKVGVRSALWGSKLLVCSALVWVSWRHSGMVVTAILGALLGFYCWVIYNNLRVLKHSA